MNNMDLLVFGSRSGDGPGPRLLIQLFPFELSDLFSPLTGKGQEFHNPSVWQWHPPGRANNGCELLVGKDAISTDFPIR